MNNTIAQMQSNRKFEKLLDLFQEIAPQNKNVQKQISILSNLKYNYIRQLQEKWNQIQPPNFTELEIRELCHSYYETLEHTNEEHSMQGLLIIILGFEDQVSMHGHPNIVFILEGSRKILTNFNLKDRNICKTPPTALNLGHKLLRLVTEMSLVWSQLKTANLLYGRAIDIDGFSKCLDLTEVTSKI
jgi:hypothetical protein